VHVLVRGEDLAQDVLARHMGEHPQLHLVVVRGQQAHALRGDEAAPHGAPDLGADGNVLEIRVDARQAPGGGGHLVERGVNAPGLGIHQVG
jgi:hypothetical protein